MARVRKVSYKDFPAPKLCGGKRCYSSKREAEHVREEQELLTHDLELSIYRCIQCGTWHLTRNKND